MIKKFLPLALTLTLGLASCSKTDTPVVPQSGITITSGVLSAYPEKEIAATGLVSLPEVTEISAKVFEGYKTLKTVKAPKLTNIGDSSFKGSELTSNELGSTVPTTSDDAFEGTSEEKDLIVPADKVADFADFAKKHHFKTINGAPIPGTEIEIKDGVLVTYPIDKTPADGVVTLEATVTEIADGVFLDNTKLTAIHAPGVKKIGKAAFKNCSALMTVDFGGAQRPPLAIDETDKIYGTAEDAFWGTPEEKVLVFDESKSPNFLQYFEFIARHHFAKLDGIKPATLDRNFKISKNGELEEIKAGGLNFLSGLGKNGVLVLPANITRIGNQVFKQSFKNFKAIYAEGVESVGDYAFDQTSSLNFAHLPKLKRVGEASFTDCASLTAVNFPHLEEIGDVSFNGGSNISGNGLKISYISMPAIKTIGRGAFYGNYKNSGVIFHFGKMPQVNDKPYDEEFDPHQGNTAFGLLKSPVLLLNEADKASYTITDGKWHGFTIKEKK